MTQEQYKERALYNACHAYIAAYARMETAMADGYNVHGAMSGLVGAEDNLRAALDLQPNAALADGEQKDLFAVALFLSCRHDPTCILKDEDAERAIGLLLRLSGFELPDPPTLNASKECHE